VQLATKLRPAHGLSRRHLHGAEGFSLIELLIVLVVLLIITGAIFQVINVSTQRSSTEQTKLDMFQEGREFMDQMSRDLRQAGYPNPRNVLGSVITQTPPINDLHAAAGVVKVDTGDLWFEGDVSGTGSVSVVVYHLDTSTSNGCPCLKRSELPKINGSPLAQTTPSYQVEVQGVQNTNIFTAFNNGTAVGLPVTTATSSGATIAAVDTVQAVLTLQAAQIDPKTRKKPVTTLVSTVKLGNCSQAAIGAPMSCQ
jgi:prepilin-type N-terminal cleavage/methylation domain-containing protein